MILTIRTPRSRRAEMSLCVLRAMFNAKPGKERKAAKRAKKAFKAAHPKKAYRAA